MYLLTLLHRNTDYTLETSSLWQHSAQFSAKIIIKQCCLVYVLLHFYSTTNTTLMELYYCAYYYINQSINQFSSTGIYHKLTSTKCLHCYTKILLNVESLGQCFEQIKAIGTLCIFSHSFVVEVDQYVFLYSTLGMNLQSTLLGRKKPWGRWRSE